MGHLLYFPLQIEYIFWKLNCLAYCKKQGHLVEAFAFEEQVGHVILELKIVYLSFLGYVLYSIYCNINEQCYKNIYQQKEYFGLLRKRKPFDYNI